LVLLLKQPHMRFFTL